MAKAKAKAKAKSKAKSKPITLPSGYKVIGRAANWDIEKHPVIEGERSEAREVTFDEGTKKERTVRTMIVVDETLGALTVWESGGLRDLFDQTEEGDVIRIEYLGLGKAKKGQNAPRLFSCAMKE
jgi:hypothetical protein